MNRRTCLFIVILLIVVLVYLLPGCDKLVTEVTEITIAGHPSAGFRAWPTSCCAPCTVYFQDTSIGPIQVWIWDFGDDSVDTFVGTVPDTIPHVYTTGGVHDVSLTVLDTTVPDTGFDTEVEHRYISIGVIPAEFAVIPDSVCPGGEITFWPPTGTIYRWMWDFGDDSTATFNNITPDSIVHTYDSVASYWVKLTVTDSCGSKTDSQLVFVSECPVVQFSANYPPPLDTISVSEGCRPLTVEFHDESVPIEGQVMNSWHWDFGNGQTSDGSPDATVQYTDTGTFVVTLTATMTLTDTSSSPPMTASDTIRVYDSTQADFIAVTPSTSCFWPSRQFQVWFKSESLGKIDSLFWAFGDGFYDSTNNSDPIHAYTELGIYSCTLIVHGICGIDTMTDTLARDSFVIYADDFTSVGFSKTPDSGTVDTVFTFTDTSSGIIINRQWIIDPQGDSVVVDDSVQVVYSFPDTADTGWHFIWLSISNNCDTSVAKDSVRVTP